jgi:outer membrane receptor for monomeric catechols
VLRGGGVNPNTFSPFFFHHNYVGFNQTDLKGSFHLLRKHQFVDGYEFDDYYHKTERSTEAESMPIPSISLYNPVETATAVTNFPATSYDRVDNTQNAVYFQDFVNIHPKLQLLLGGRYDAYRRYDFNCPWSTESGSTAVRSTGSRKIPSPIAWESSRRSSPS